MNLIIVRNKYRIHIVQLIDQIHSLVISQQEAGGTESIRRQRRVCDDRYAVKIIFTRVSGRRIQDMVVNFYPRP